MKTIGEILRNDKEIQRYERKHEEMYGKPALPYCLWEDESVEKYKEKLKKLVEE